MSGIAPAGELPGLLADFRDDAAPPDVLQRRWERLSARLTDDLNEDEAALPDGVAGAPCDIGARTYHARFLSATEWARDPLWLRLRIEYHLKMLGRLLAPSEEQLRPRVSVVIPVHNACDCLGRALDSCEAQDYPELEVVVVDDGSTDGSGDVAAGHGACARLVRQEHGGVAAARNAGLARATGDLVHFLDADDELLPGAVTAKIAALSRVADAQVCYSHSQSGTDSPLPDWVSLPLDGPDSATMDALFATIGFYAFETSTVLVARWFLERVGRFDADLRQGEDGRYWFRMARAGLKAIALRTRVTRRHLREAGLTRSRVEALHWAFECALRNIDDLAGEPDLYRYVAVGVGRINCLFDEARRLGWDGPELERVQQRVLDFERHIGREVANADGPTTVLLHQLVHALSDHDGGKRSRGTRFWRERREALRERLRGSAAPSAAVLQRWLPRLQPLPFVELRPGDRAALWQAMRQLHSAVVHRRLPVRWCVLRNVGLVYPGHPYERRWKTLSRLSRLVGERAASLSMAWISRALRVTGT